MQLLIISENPKRKIQLELVKDILALSKIGITYELHETESDGDESPKKKKESKIKGGGNHYHNYSQKQQSFESMLVTPFHRTTECKTF